MHQLTLTLDISRLKPHQHEALNKLLASLKEPYYIPTPPESDPVEENNFFC